MLLPLLGYFFCMIAVLTAAAGVMIGLFNFSTSGKVHHYPHLRPEIERSVTATNTECHSDKHGTASLYGRTWNKRRIACEGYRRL